MRAAPLAAAALLALGQIGPCWANAGDDANAAIERINAGDYDGGIALLSRALRSGQLSQDDTELAYATRGKAYLSKGDTSHAVADLDHARQIKPDDTDAQNDLNTALQQEIPADSIPGRPKPGFGDFLGDFVKALLGAFVGGLATALQQQSEQQ